MFFLYKLYSYMVKILQINTTIDRSTGSIVQAIGEQVMAEGWQSIIAFSSRYRNQNSQSQLLPIGSRLDAQIHALQTRLFDNHGFCSIRATKNLITRIKVEKPDIVHLHNIHGYYLNITLLFDFLRKSNTATVWTLHDCWAMTGHCSHFDAIGCMKWKTGCYNCELKRDYPSSIFFDRSQINWIRKKEIFTSLTNLKIVPVSFWLESIVQNSFLKKCSTKVIHNGIDLDIFSPIQNNFIRNRYDLGKHLIILGVATGWFEGGGLRRYKEFMKLSSMLDDNYRIILIGLEEFQIKDLPLNVIGLQRTGDPRELAEFYSAADVFVNPTYQDSLPTVNMEALACGTPVITYNTGGSPEIIDKGTGWVVEKGDIVSMVNCIKHLRQESIEERKNRRAACRKRAEMYFNKYERFHDYIVLYKQILHL